MTSSRHTVAEKEGLLVGGPRTVASLFTLSQLQILLGISCRTCWIMFLKRSPSWVSIYFTDSISALALLVEVIVYLIEVLVF